MEFSGHFFLLSVHVSLKKKPVMPNLPCGRVPSPVCSVCVCVCVCVCVLYNLMQVLLLSVGHGIAGPCFICGAHNRDVMIGGRVPRPVLSLTPSPARCLGGRGRRSKVGPWQLMRQTTLV